MLSQAIKPGEKHRVHFRTRPAEHLHARNDPYNPSGGGPVHAARGGVQPNYGLEGAALAFARNESGPGCDNVAYDGKGSRCASA